MSEIPSFTRPPVLVLMGVTGTGKSTVAGVLAGRLDWDLCDGDDLHPPENVRKMAAGHPLTDEDGRIDGYLDDGAASELTSTYANQVRDEIQALRG